MSRTLHEAIHVPEAGIGGNQYPPQSAQNQPPHGVSNFVDGSGPIFSMYLEMATEEDRKMVESWKADADGILIFTGLFSAAVASLISVSVQDIRPNPQDTSNFYLANIYQAIVDPNRPIANISLPSSPPTFSPPNYAVWVNSLWFMSLVISVTCALLATLLQQWARRYLKVTQPRYSPHRRARIRTFFFEGVEKYLLPWVVDALPTLLHVSLYLFFAGLVVFLCNVNLTVFKLVLSWFGVCAVVYGCITLMPIFRHDNPFNTPLTLPAWHIVTGVSYIVLRVLRRLTFLDYFSFGTYDRFQSLEITYRKLLAQGMQKTAEESALNSPSEIDTRVLMWTFDSLDEDHELERFFFGLPGFRSSNVIDDPLPSLTWEQQTKLSTALVGLFDRTFSSDLLPESVKNWRAIICARALDPQLFSYEYQQVMGSIMFGVKCRGLQTSKFGCIMSGWGNGGNQGTALVTQAIVTNIVAGAQRRDDSWFVLASNALGVPESVLRDYASNGDSLSFAVLIHITRQQFSHYQKPFWPRSEISFVLEAASYLNVRTTSPELQHEFCALWNQIVLKVQNDNDQWMASLILEPIRNVYVDLHQDADSAPTRFFPSIGDQDDLILSPSYPLCNVTSHIYDDSASASFTRTNLHDGSAVVPESLANPSAPSSAVPSPPHAAKSFDVPPLEDDIYVSGSIHAHQTTTEDARILVTSPDSFTTRVIPDGTNTSTGTVPLSVPDILSSTLSASKAWIHPTGVADVQHSEHRRTSSDAPDAPSSPSPVPVLDDVFPTESQSSAAPLDQSRPRLPVTEGESGASATLHKGKNAFHPPSPTSDPPPHSPSPEPTTGVTIAGPSQRSLDAEYTGDHTPGL